MNWHWNHYELTDDRSRMDFETVFNLLAQTYWASDRPRDLQRTAFEHSICFSLFQEGRQIGFARAISDHATFAWIADVIIHPDHRAAGLGKWMMSCILEHPGLATRSQWLATKDAHTLYERFGFIRFEALRRGPPLPGEPDPATNPPPRDLPNPCC
jgi:GNAT superfamily N-acetyltransferase